MSYPVITNRTETDDKGRTIYVETTTMIDGGYPTDSIIRKRNDVGLEVYREHINYYDDSKGKTLFWNKWDYDDNNHCIYKENSEGDWIKQKWSNDGKLLYFENHTGYYCNYNWATDGTFRKTEGYK